MAHSLVSFHFTPYKTGQIIKQYAKDRGISQASMAAKTGLSFDTVGNIYGGKVQKIPFEYLFKMCVVLAIPIEVVMMLMLKDEDIDFEDQVLLYNSAEDKSVPVADAVPTLIAGTVPDAVADTAVAVAAASPVIEAVAAAAESVHNTYYTAEDIEEAVEKAKETYRDYIKDLKDSFANERAAYSRNCEQMHQLAMSILEVKR